MSEWPTMALGELCLSLEDGDWIETKDQGGDEYRLLQVSNVGVGSFRETGNYRYVTQETFDRLRCSEIKVGDILVSRMPDPVGRAWHVKKQMPWKAITAVDVTIVSPDPQKLDAAFCAYYLNSPQNLNFAAARAGGTTRLRITRRDLATFPIPHPPLAKQRCIASILSAYDDLIENNTRRIAILEDMARRIYEEWFVHFRFPGHEHVRMVESELGPVSKEWRCARLEDIAMITMGLSPKGDTYNESAEGTPLINGPVEFGEKFTKQVKWTTAPTKLCDAGDLIVCVRGSTTGKYVKSDGTYCLGRGVCSIHGRCQAFVDQLFIHELPTLLAQTGGSTFPSWTGPQIKAHPVLIPTEVLITEFDRLAQPMSGAIQVLSRQSKNLRTTRDLLLPRLISGELDVSELPEPEAVAA